MGRVAASAAGIVLAASSEVSDSDGGQRMQDIDRPADVEPFAKPARHRCSGVDVEASCVVVLSQCLFRIRWYCGGQRHVEQYVSVRPPEAKLAVRLSFHPIALFVDRTVMPATQHRKVRERRRTSVRPVTNVMPLTERQPAAREATAAIAML